MAYEKPITIKLAIENIADGKYVLPSIQREFVWGPSQIETLFDSLMRDYPISTFLFWNVKKENISKFKFYSFLREYHERTGRHNLPASFSEKEDIIAILDGQQRLTSIYLALKGSYASKIPYLRKANDQAYPPKHLYLNILKAAEGEEKEYDFQFLTNGEAARKDAEHLWIKAGTVLDFDAYEDATDWIHDTLDDFSDTLEIPIDREVKKEARKRFSTLYRVVCDRETVNFFLERSEELDKVLQIFIRINQGGTPLSYSDLLLSIATAQWKTLDARQEIHTFVDKINDIGKGFNFNKDFVLKNCLVLADIKNILFKVDNFSTENMEIIESQWSEITSAVSLAIKLAAHYGFNAKTLTSTNAIIPIAYFIKVNGYDEEWLLHGKHAKQIREDIKLWLLRVLLKRQFGGTPDGLYSTYRQIIKGNLGKFPLKEIVSNYAGTNKSLDFYEEDINNLMKLNYGSAFTFMVLSLFYKLNHDYQFHQDHIHPKKFFSNRGLKKMNIEEVKYEAFQHRFNSLANLQLLQATPNLEKSEAMFEDWLTNSYTSSEEVNAYKSLHFIPQDTSLKFEDFITFFDARERLIRHKIEEILDVKQLNS